MQKIQTPSKMDPLTSPSDAKPPPYTKPTNTNPPEKDIITIRNIAKMFGFC